MEPLPQPGLADDLPVWEEAPQERILTTKHFPKAAREEWARTLRATVGEVCANMGEEKSWKRLYILARCILVARPGEQGAADGRSAAQRVKDACRR